MPTLSVNLADVPSDLASFPLGVYEAQVLSADLEIAKSSGNPMIVVNFEIHHPDLGTATIKDFLSPGFKSKIKAFWMAANGFTHEQARDALAQGADIELDPDEMVGTQLLVNIGEKAARDGSGRMFKEVAPPFFFPSTRQDLVKWGSEDLPV